LLGCGYPRNPLVCVIVGKVSWVRWGGLKWAGVEWGGVE
jgi:hypothetical protein